MTKDTIAGRLRRLLTLADDTAHHTGIPDATTNPATQTSPCPASPKGDTPLAFRSSQREVT